MQEAHRLQFYTRYTVLENGYNLVNISGSSCQIPWQRRSILSALTVGIFRDFFTLQVHKITPLVLALFDNEPLCVYIYYSRVKCKHYRAASSNVKRK